jgi:unsaturated rhamnogalacturonyl hydrolase
MLKRRTDEKYRKAADLIRSQFKGHPRIKAGGLWHKKIYPWQMWLDGLYMGQPFYAEYAKLFGETDIFDDVVNQFILIHDNLRDKKTGLYYHAWDESRQMFWADKKTGLSQCIWGRGMGWFCMAIVDVLDFLPETHPGRQQMISMLGELAEAITQYQDPATGLWWQIMDQGGREGNYLEGSGSAMFVYSLAKAVRNKYIDQGYMDTVLKGFKGLTTDLMYQDSRGDYNLLRCCQGAGLGGKYRNKIRDGSYEYYVYIEPIIPNDGKATGPFMAACIELARMGY